ncbi:MAG: FkbM family methyltransferase [Myxococcota bacterium]
MLGSRLFKAYARGPAHPAKLRVVRWLTRTVVPTRGLDHDVGHGLRLWLHPRDWLEYRMLRGLPYEPLTLAFLADNAGTGDTVALAGVNFGLHVAVAARHVGPSGRVIGFEPQPGALLRTRANLELNGLENVELVAAALGEGPMLAAMNWAPEDNPATASLAKDVGRAGGLRVPVLPLGPTLAGLEVERLRLLLLDVEGYEELALKGLPGGPLPELIVVEALDANLATAGSGVAALVARLEGLGYDLHDLHGRRRTATTAMSTAENNLVAVRRGAPPPRFVPEATIARPAPPDADG